MDFDGLSLIHPHAPGDPHGSDLAFRNLTSIWANDRAAGIERLVIAAVVERRSELAHYEEAVPGAEIVLCRLLAPIATMHDRLRSRDPGIYLTQFLARSTELDGILAAGRIEDFAVDNGPDRHVTVVAREVLQRAGWN